MKKQKAIRLLGSDEPLIFPNGDVETEVLERILEDATIKNVSKDRLVITTHHERVANWNPDNPRWKNVAYRVPLSELYELHVDLTGQEFRIKSEEEKERDVMRQAARRIYR